tara:strand:- start:2090 stop:2791 length:702 start_codon:yes stop_codon:yes gene_type:complete
MGFLDNTTITVDAILTKKGRELLARGQNEFRITKFALADDEIDYNLYDTSHPNGSNFYGAVIENMPVIEAFVDENQLMRYKLTTLPKETAKLPILELPNPSLTFNGPGITQTITPNTRNGVDQSYIFIIQDASIANITQLTSAGGGNVNATTPPRRLPDGTLEDDFLVKSGTTTPVFLNESERKRSITITGKSVNVISRSITTQTSTNVTVIGADTGATFNLPITVKADPSKL